MKLFLILFLFIIFQRVMELVIARNNEAWMKQQGAKEYGQEHYRWIVLIHGSFLLSLALEVWFMKESLIGGWQFVLSIFITAQLARVWVIASLGRFWNTKILVLPKETLVSKGPYRWIKHPNYWIVAIEFITIPLLFQAFVTLTVFTVVNGMFLLLVRIPEEEKALHSP